MNVLEENFILKTKMIGLRVALVGVKSPALPNRDGRE